MGITSGASLDSLFCEQLQLCGVKAGETVAVLSEGQLNKEYRELFLRSIEALDATAVNINLPSDVQNLDQRLRNMGRTTLADHPQEMPKLYTADLVIDLTLLLFSDEQRKIQEAGARVLMVVEPSEILQRLFSTKDLRDRVEAAESRLKRASKLRFTNQAGTDVTYHLGHYEMLAEYGYTDLPGRWDSWPGGLIATSPNDGSVEGRVIMDHGDIIYPFMETVESVVEFIVESGRVTAINGDKQANMLWDFMRSFDDPLAYEISHIGWGLNENAIWSTDVPGIGLDGRTYHGGVLFSTGPNTELGGTNNTACHLDLPMRNCTLYLDDKMIIDKGNVLPDDMRPMKTNPPN
jgi:2,5-dihydroxypyridine 5,6-dioxygenase